MGLNHYTYDQPFQLENGEELPSLEVAYHTYGELNEDRSNVVWVCHNLTASSDVKDWWSILVGPGRAIDPARHFVICTNILGSCYGTSGPTSINPKTQKPYYSDFPEFTLRDMVRVQDLVRRHLHIDRIAIGLSGSMGGFQLMEWALLQPQLFERLILIATAARESAWGIAIHTTQRMAIENDPTWKDHTANAGANGLKTARGIGMLTYRTADLFVRTQTDPDDQKTDQFKAESYIRYQGNKLAERFNAYAYWLLTKAMDSHNVGRDRGGVENALKTVNAEALVIGISSDLLHPVSEQQELAAMLPNGRCEIIDSPYGHDGFLIEETALNQSIQRFLNS